MYIRNSKPAPVAKTRDRFLTFNDLVNDLFGDVKSPVLNRTEAPKVNVYNEPDRFKVEMLVPGFEKEQLKITVQEEKLVVNGTLQSKNESVEAFSTRKEFTVQSFTKSFNLPDTANPELITASYTNGILEVIIPKREEAKPSQPKEVIVS
ncbi:MAG: Hsp20/alpha crystallin family protein [Bacteroidota bacterium]